MVFECANNIFKGAVSRIGKLYLNYLAKLVLERFRAAFFHLRFRKCFLIPNSFGIVIIEIISHGTRKTVPDTLLTEILRHLIKITLIAAISSAVHHITVADKKMRVDVIGVGVNGKQNFIAFLVSEFLRKISRNLICGYVVHIIIGVKRDRHLMCEDSIFC